MEMTRDFADNQILPQVPAIEAKQYEVSKELMRELGELGLLGVDTPEQYGGLEMDKVTSTLVAQNLSVVGSFAVTFSAHTGIGMLPLIWYGTPDQRAAYLPKLASGEWIAAYALSESSAGSDAMNIRTRATLTPDGRPTICSTAKRCGSRMPASLTCLQSLRRSMASSSPRSWWKRGPKA